MFEGLIAVDTDLESLKGFFQGFAGVLKHACWLATMLQSLTLPYLQLTTCAQKLLLPRHNICLAWFLQPAALPFPCAFNIAAYTQLNA